MTKVILISGKLRSGKNQLTAFLKDLLQEKGKLVSEDMFAKDLKDGAKKDFKQLSNTLNGIASELEALLDRLFDAGVEHCIISDFEDEIKKLKVSDHNFYEEKTQITRSLLQLYGTEIFRDRVNENHWVEQVISRIRESDSDYIFITDVRFENEISHLETVLENKIIRVRVDRPMSREDIENEHPSEKGLDNYCNWDFHILNDGSLDDFRNQAKILSERLLV